MKIGVILAGAAGKGVYELGVMQALVDYFGLSCIRCVSSASIGMLVGQTFGLGKTDELIQAWKSIGHKSGRFFLSLSGNQDILRKISIMLSTGGPIAYEHYVSIWNYTKHRVEYIPFHTLSGERLRQYIRGAVAIPLFNSGEKIDGDRILDGAFLDHIPAYPLVEKELDFIFCVYFDNCSYTFEGPEFDRKVIRLFDFPNKDRLELLKFDHFTFDDKFRYAYDYAMDLIKGLFRGRNRQEIYNAIVEMEQNRGCIFKPRLTAETVLCNINRVTGKYAHRLSHRQKTQNRDH